jgi:hypothetical protein
MMWSAGSDDQWNTFRQVKHRANYIFVTRDRNCIGGKIKHMNDSAVTITQENASEIVIQQPDLLRITYGAWGPGVIFSRRSSWSDIVSIVGKNFQPEIVVLMTSGQEHKGKLVGASDKSMILKSSGRPLNIVKDQVSMVSYIRPKPLGESAAYADDELAWMKVFDPQLWPQLLHLESYLSIRLYDSSLPEDSSAIVCNADPWVHSQPGPDVTSAPYPPPTP